MDGPLLADITRASVKSPLRSSKSAVVQSGMLLLLVQFQEESVKRPSSVEAKMSPLSWLLALSHSIAITLGRRENERGVRGALEHVDAGKVKREAPILLGVLRNVEC